MKLSPLKSSNLEAAGYDPATRTLTVKFKNGGTYHYNGCTKEHYEGLLAAESAGKYLHKHIKSAYKHTKSDTGKAA